MNVKMFMASNIKYVELFFFNFKAKLENEKF